MSLPGSRVPGGCPTRVLRASGNLSDRPVSSTEPRRLATRRSETATVLRVARAPEPPFSALPGFWVQAQQLRLLRAGGERGALGCSRPGPPLRSRVRARSARGQLRPRVTCRLRAAAVAPARATALGLCWSAPGSCAPLRATTLSDLALFIYFFKFFFFTLWLSLTFPFSFLFSPFLYLLFFFSKRRQKALQVGGDLSLPTNSFSAWWWRSWLLLPLSSSPSCSSSAFSSFFRYKALAACWSPKPALLLSMPSGPAGA